MPNKESALKEAAWRVFSAKGYKAANVAEIAREAHVAVGSFYNYYPSKDEIFLEVYIEENDRVRQQIVDDIDWSAAPADAVGRLCELSFKLVSNNQILSAWNQPVISDKLHAHYLSNQGKGSYPFHQFLLDTFTTRMSEEGFPEEKIRQVLQVYELLYLVDMTITERDFPGYSETIQTLTSYFVKGLFSTER